MGAAMLAMVGCGVYATVEDACRAIVRTEREYLPEPELAEKYEKRYRTFRAIYPACKELFPKLGE